MQFIKYAIKKYKELNSKQQEILVNLLEQDLKDLKAEKKNHKNFKG